MPKANGSGLGRDAMDIGAKASYPKQRDHIVKNGTPSKAYRAHRKSRSGSEFVAEGIDSDETTMGFPEDQLLGFEPGSSKTRNTKF